MRQACVFVKLLLALFVVVGYGVPAIEDSGTLELIRKIPHSGYSEGLDFHQGFLWNAFPKSISKISPKDGTVLLRFSPATDYSESIIWFKGKMVNLSFANNGIYEGSLDALGKPTWNRKGTVPEVHAWGMTHNDTHIIITGDYSSKLYFINPKTWTSERSVTTPISDLEDLAWDGKGIWASSFTSYRGRIFRFDPKTGSLQGIFKLPNPEECPVIDGIAFDGQGLWVTGKECPSIYFVKKPAEAKLSK